MYHGRRVPKYFMPQLLSILCIEYFHQVHMDLAALAQSAAVDATCSNALQLYYYCVLVAQLIILYSSAVLL
jgi:hypothetical protein